MNVITDEKQVDELLNRGVETIYPNKKELKEKLMKGEKIKLYCGFDPTAPSMHIGNAIAINKLSQFQAMGHEVCFLIGGFTSMIGDPTDKAAARKRMTRDEVMENAESYKKQASAYLDFDGENKAKVVYNSDWLDKISFKDLIEISANFTVQQMIQRDMFQKRLEEEKPIYLHEFLYPLAQGYDSVALDVDLEIGGNDQMFNMMAGRDLMKALGMRNKFVMTLKLLADDSGKKMGKSEGNAVFLDQEPNNIYGSVMSWVDGVIGVAFELCTKLPIEEVREIQKSLTDGRVNPRDLKMKLAYEMTKIIHDEEAAKKAEEYFINTFQKKEIPDEIEEKKYEVDGMNILDLLVDTKLVSSKGEGRRMLKQNAVKLDGEIINDEKLEINIDSKGKILQKGKRGFIKILK